MVYRNHHVFVVIFTLSQQKQPIMPCGKQIATHISLRPSLLLLGELYYIYNNSPVVRPRWLGLSIDQNHFKSPLRREQLLCYYTIALGMGDGYIYLCIYIDGTHTFKQVILALYVCVYVCLGQGLRNHFLTGCHIHTNR